MMIYSKCMFFRIYFIGALTIFAVTFSCSHTSRKSQQLSDVGVKYADAMGGLIDVTTDTVINDDSDTLLYIQKLGRTGSFWMPG